MNTGTQVVVIGVIVAAFFGYIFMTPEGSKKSLGSASRGSVSRGVYHDKSPVPPPGGYYIVGYKDPPGPRARIGMGAVAATMAEAKKEASSMESSGFYARIRKTKPRGW